MQAHHYSARLAPKKASLVAKMVRGMPVPDAVELLRKTHKKGARLLEDVLRSAIANAEHNFKQDPQTMIIKTVVVNQGTHYQRGIPMARGRVRPIKKFLCHISLELGFKETVQKVKKVKKGQTKTVQKGQRGQKGQTSDVATKTTSATSVTSETSETSSTPSS